MEFDIEETVGAMADALKEELLDGWSTVSSFVQMQSKQLATQAQMIATSRAAGSLRTDDDLFEFFIEQLKDKTENFARTVAALTVLTLEKAWNAAVGVLWGAIDKVLAGVGLAPLNLPGVPNA